MKKQLLVFMTLGSIALASHSSFSQTGIGTLTPDPSAQLDVTATNKGILVPRINSSQRTSIASPAEGLLVFDTDTKTFWFFKTGTGWTEINSSALTLPYSAIENNPAELFSITNDGDGVSVAGINTSATSSISAVRGIVSSTAPGGFSSGVRGINNGTGGLGIGIYGSHAGSGWGVYGTTPNGLGVYGNSSANGYGVYANSNTGIGLQAQSVNGVAANISILNNANNNHVLDVSNVGNGIVINASTTGNGAGVLSSTAAGFSIHGITTHETSAGIVGDNNGGGEAIVGRTTSDIAGAVVGRNDGGGYGVRGFVATNTSGNGVGVYGQVGLNNSTGSAGKFENLNSNNESDVVTVTNVGNGIAGNFFVNRPTGLSPAVKGEVNSIFSNFGTAGIYGLSSGTGGVAGLFYSSNSSGGGAALIALTEGTGNAISTSAGGNGDGIRASCDGTGNAVSGTVPNFGTGKAGRFGNYNTSNAQPVVHITNDGTGSALLINHSGPTGNLAIFQNNGSNVARINKQGRGFFNGGTTNSGADLAEAFDVTEDISQYEPGDVLCISQNEDRTVDKSAESYSTLVLGVYATKPGVLLTEEHIDSDLTNKVPMGVVGVIPTKVCIEGGAIKRGDLLVTSSIRGVAMKANPDKLKPGQIIGKALQNYEETGVGKINVFVNVK